MFFNPEDGGKVFLRTFGYYLPKCAISQPRIFNLESNEYFINAELSE
jgi:hypothetical protein